MHTHLPMSVDDGGNNVSPAGNTWAQALNGRVGDRMYSAGQPPNLSMSPQAVGPNGGSQPHNNMPPYQCVTFIIALQGIYPQRP